MYPNTLNLVKLVESGLHEKENFMYFRGVRLLHSLLINILSSMDFVG